MALSARILSIGDDDNLRLSRELILRKEGYEVKSVTSNDALKALPPGSFDIAIISQSVAHGRAMHVAAVLRAINPGIRILRVQELPSVPDHSYDLDCETFSGPGAFLNAVKALCGSAGAAQKVEPVNLNAP